MKIKIVKYMNGFGYFNKFELQPYWLLDTPLANNFGVEFFTKMDDIIHQEPLGEDIYTVCPLCRLIIRSSQCCNTIEPLSYCNCEEEAKKTTKYKVVTPKYESFFAGGKYQLKYRVGHEIKAIQNSLGIFLLDTLDQARKWTGFGHRILKVQTLSPVLSPPNISRFYEESCLNGYYCLKSFHFFFSTKKGIKETCCKRIKVLSEEKI